MQGLNPIVIIVGVILVIMIFFGVIFFAINQYGGNRSQMQKRVDRIKQRFDPKATAADQVRSIIVKQSGGALDDILREIMPRPAEFKKRLDRTGKKMTLQSYAIFCGVTFVLVFGAIVVASGFPVTLAILIGFVAGLGVPHMYVSIMINKRIDKFTSLFPDAIDLIVRGLKSGLPVTESMSAAGQEIEDPVGVEFRQVTDSVRLGATMNDALWDAANRLDTPDFKFFVICLSIQQETGGNLAETLANLGDILRRRKQLKLKINALSSEGKASAYIIGSLPFIMAALIITLNYEYGSVLFTDPRMIVACIGGMIWMCVGAFFIWRLINFDV